MEDFGRKIVELGGKNCVDNGKNWVDYSEFENGWNNLTLSGHDCFGSMRNSSDFSSQHCTFA